MEYGILRVTTPDGQVREFPIETPSVTLGRSADNGITVDHVSVSRRHAHLKIEDGRLFVQDIGSATGTFIGSQRVSNTEFHPVDDGQVLRFGDCEARFLTESGPGDDTPTGSVTTPEGQATVAVSLQSPSQPISPGSASTATVVIHNRGKVVDQVSLTVPDLPPAWVQVRRPSLSLAPGARDEVTILIQPPKKPESTAGEHEFAVAATSSEQGREVRVLGRFTILPFEEFKFSMKGPQGKNQYNLSLNNLGNASADYTLSAKDDEDALNYELAEETVRVEPGQERTVVLKANPKKKNPFGRDKTWRFEAAARPSTGGDAATAGANLRYRAPLKQWKYYLGGFLGVSILSTAVLMQRAGSLPDLFGGGASDPQPTATIAAAGNGDPTAAPTATPDGLHVGASADVINSPEGDCLRVRQGPTLTESDPDSAILGQLCDGDTVSITDGPVESGNFTWWRIDDGQGLTGWAAEGPSSGQGEVFMRLRN